MQTNRSYLNTVLTVIAVLLGLNLAVQWSSNGSSSGPGAAVAQPVKVEDTPPFNAAEQRRQMINQLQEINRRLTAVEGKLDRGLNVKVLSMPPVRVEGGQGESK